MASRKNFPARIEARRLRALERNNAAFVSAIPIPVSARPIATPDVSDLAPVAPTLARFGLSEDAVRRLPKPWFRNAVVIGAREVWTYVCMHTATFVLLFHNMIRPSFPTIIGFLGFSFLFCNPLHDILGSD